MKRLSEIWAAAKDADMREVAERIFNWEPRPRAARYYYNEAAKTRARLYQENKLKADHSLTNRLQSDLHEFFQSVKSESLETIRQGKFELKRKARGGENHQAIWDYVESHHKTLDLYFAFPFVRPRKEETGDGGIAFGRRFLSYLKKEQAPVAAIMKDLFDYCYNNDLAIQFSYPEEVNKLPEPYQRSLDRHGIDNLQFSRMTITVSPLDRHHMPLTVGRYFKDVLPPNTRPDRQMDHFRSFNFDRELRCRFHPYNAIGRILTGQKYKN